MSLSWIRALRPAVACRAGIAIGRRHVTAVVVQGDGSAPAVHTRALPVPLFEAEPGLPAEDALVQALVAVSAAFRQRYAAVHVALPDFALRSSVFEFDELPKKPALRQALLRWRFAQAWQRSEDSLECRGQALGPEGARQLLFAQGGDRAWLACVRRALARAGVGPWSLNAAAAYRFNGLPTAVAAAPGALLGLDPDAWTLQLWDAQGRVRHVLTRLRDGAPAAAQAAAIADETERAILSYIQADAGRRVDRLYLAGDHEAVAAVAPVFTARLREPAQPLAPAVAAGASAPLLAEGLAPLALAAAMSAEAAA